MTRPYAEVIGDPIVQSKSPAIHGFWLKALGIEAEYRAAHVTAEGLADYITARRGDPLWRGCNVTMPHKQAVMPLLDRIDPLAARIGAVNTVVRDAAGMLTGFNTDAPGFAEPLGDVPVGSATLVGAGGAARAILLALAERKVGQIALMNRNVDKARALLDELGIVGEAFALGARVPVADLLVNSSSLGMVGHPPLPEGLLDDVAPGGLVYDIVTSPLRTHLLDQAAQRGLRTIDGLSMLIGQADHAFARFFGQHPPRARDADLRGLIGG